MGNNVWKKRMRRKICTAAFVTALSMHGSTIACAGVYSVGTDENDYLPYYRALAFRELEGFGRDILDRFGKDHQHRFIYKSLPIRRLQREFLQGNIDFTFPDSPRWALKLKEGSKILYSSPIVQYVDGIHTQNGQPLKSSQVPNISIVRGFTPFAFLDLIKQKKIHFVNAPDLQAAIKMVGKNHVDGVYGNNAVVLFKAEQLGIDHLSLAKGQQSAKDYYFLSTIKHSKLIDEFNIWMNKNQTLMNDLKRKYDLPTED